MSAGASSRPPLGAAAAPIAHYCNDSEPIRQSIVQGLQLNRVFDELQQGTQYFAAVAPHVSVRA